MFLQGTVNGQSFLYSGFPNVLVNCQNRTSRYVSGNSCTPVRGLLIIIHVCTWIESRKRLSITNLWQFLSWVIKRICNLPIPNEAGRALGTVAYMYKTHIKNAVANLWYVFVRQCNQHVRCEWLSGAANCQYRMNTICQFGQLHTYTMATNFFPVIVYKYAVNGYRYWSNSV